VTQRSKKKARVRAPLTELESEVMKAVWSGVRSSVEGVHRAVARKYDLKETTVRTLLRRLEQKGYLEHEAEGRAYLYRAAEPPGISRPARCGRSSTASAKGPSKSSSAGWSTARC
jgi:predicted ArsR family transcriptional regulator